MFIIYEVKTRLVTGDISELELGYVEDEDKAKEICKKLNDGVKYKNEKNTMGNWFYHYKKINKIKGITLV